MKEKLLLEIYNTTAQHTEAGGSLIDGLEICTDRYENRKEIAAGGMKIIFRCNDVHTDREIVLVTPKEESMNKLFIREGRINAYLQHPGISPVYDIGLLEEGKPFFTSKLIHGKPLSEIDFKNDPDKSVDTVIKICEAISYAHSRGIVHQDLKPDNIIIDDFGEVIIIDWGLAEIDDSAEGGHDSILDKEMENLLLYSIPEEFKKLRGTPGFIAPERYKANLPRQTNDIYSIGGLLYCLLSGNNPDKSRAYSEVTPPGLKAICEKCLHKDPQSRYTGVKEILKELNRFRHGFATHAESASPWRLMKLLYERNRKLCLSLFISINVIIIILTVSLIMINHSRNNALGEKEKAVNANAENLKLLEELKAKESERRKFMKLSAKSQLVKLNELLDQRRIKEVEPLLDFTLQLDPNSPEINRFKACFELMNYRLESAIKIFRKFGRQEAAETIAEIDPEDPDSLNESMLKLDKIFSKDMGFYFAVNSVRRFSKIEDKVKLYKWVIYFEHPGMKHIPEVQLSIIDGKKKISLSQTFAVKKCGPIHLLEPQILDLSHTNNMAIASMSQCQNLEELNLANTRFLSLSHIEFNSLKKLNLSKTILNNILPDKFPALEILNISGALWKQFNRIREFESLKELIVDEDQAKRIKNFSGLSNLKITVE